MNTCILCDSCLQEIKTREANGVTSDGRVWPSHGTLLWCSSCGHVQKETSLAWKADIDAIYSMYTVYPIAGSKDQQLFLDGKSSAVPRFNVLMEKLMECLALNEQGALLDYGCGNGNCLQAFSSFLPHWELHGHEYSAKNKEKILTLANVLSFTYGDVTHVKGMFDGISMQHVLEHLLDPRATLKELVRHIKEDGWLFTQVPTFWNDPFELMIVDHCSHFTETALHNLLVEAQLQNIQSTTGWIPKNIGFVSRQKNKLQTKREPHKEKIYERLCMCLNWLFNLPSAIKKEVHTKRLGILGTSNAATWTASMLPERVSFFVDEDPSHWGCSHLGLPVVSPEQTTPNDMIFIAFSPQIAAQIAARLNQNCLGFYFTVPWTP